jgi:hypothetical protein
MDRPGKQYEHHESERRPAEVPGSPPGARAKVGDPWLPQNGRRDFCDFSVEQLNEVEVLDNDCGQK